MHGEALTARSLCYCVRKFCAYLSNSPLCSTDLVLTMFDYLYIVSCLGGFSSYIAQNSVCVSVISRQSTVSSTSARTSQTTKSTSIVNINIFI